MLAGQLPSLVVERVSVPVIRRARNTLTWPSSSLQRAGDSSECRSRQGGSGQTSPMLALRTAVRRSTIAGSGHLAGAVPWNIGSMRQRVGVGRIGGRRALPTEVAWWLGDGARRSDGAPARLARRPIAGTPARRPVRLPRRRAVGGATSDVQVRIELSSRHDHLPSDEDRTKLEHRDRRLPLSY